QKSIIYQNFYNCQNTWVVVLQSLNQRFRNYRMKLQSSKKHKTNKAYNFYNSPLPSGRLNQFVNNLLTTAKYFDSGHCVYTFVSPKRKTNEKRQHQSRSNKKGSSLYHHTF